MYKIEIFSASDPLDLEQDIQKWFEFREQFANEKKLEFILLFFTTETIVTKDNEIIYQANIVWKYSRPKSGNFSAYNQKNL